MARGPMPLVTCPGRCSVAERCSYTLSDTGSFVRAEVAEVVRCAAPKIADTCGARRERCSRLASGRSRRLIVDRRR
jgi:hypothetical protein